LVRWRALGEDQFSSQWIDLVRSRGIIDGLWAGWVTWSRADIARSPYYDGVQPLQSLGRRGIWQQIFEKVAGAPEPPEHQALLLSAQGFQAHGHALRQTRSKLLLRLPRRRRGQLDVS
jgi:hypothetical protein